MHSLFHHEYPQIPYVNLCREFDFEEMKLFRKGFKVQNLNLKRVKIKTEKIEFIDNENEINDVNQAKINKKFIRRNLTTI